MPSLADLIRMGKQYVSDALPGGSLNPEVNRQVILDGAALSTTAVPVLGDLLGLGADINRYATDPESRTAGNFALSGLGMLPFVPAMTAWHGSPHKFDKFALEKIGTGEGKQQQGMGVYLAEAKAVGERYADRLAEMHGKDAGQLDKVDLPDEAMPSIAQYDAPFSQQSERVKNAVAPLLDERVLHNLRGYYGWESHQDAPMQAIMESIDIAKGNDRNATASALKANGVLGVKYLDGVSRGTGAGSSNFVMFDPDLIRILERNGHATGLEPWKPGEYSLKDLITK